MEKSTELASAQRQVFEKIGRNVVAFQEMEVMMKFLIANQKIEGFADTLQRNFDDSRRRVERATMGNLVNRLFQSCIAEDKDEEDSPTEDDRLWSISFRIKLDPDFWSETKAGFESLVEERNQLIHQLALKLDRSSVDSCISLSKSLDEQLDAINPHFELLRSSVRMAIDGREALLGQIDSEVFPATQQE